MSKKLNRFLKFITHVYDDVEATSIFHFTLSAVRLILNFITVK